MEDKKTNKYKCHTCKTIVEVEKKEDACPMCGDVYLQEMCENDHVCTCGCDVSYGLKTCDKCGQPTCPDGCHDVLFLSRVTGYIQDYSGFNEAKKSEVRNRHRTSIE